MNAYGPPIAALGAILSSVIAIALAKRIDRVLSQGSELSLSAAEEEQSVQCVLDITS